MGIDLDVLNPHSFDLIVGADDEWAVKYEDRPLDRPDFIICRTGAETDYFTLALLRHFERRGVRLVNGPATIERVADKLHTLQRLNRAGLPTRSAAHSILAAPSVRPWRCASANGSPSRRSTARDCRPTLRSRRASPSARGRSTSRAVWARTPTEPPPSLVRALREKPASLSCTPILDHLAGADPAFRRQGGPCAADTDSSDIGGLLPIALCGRTSL